MGIAPIHTAPLADTVLDQCRGHCVGPVLNFYLEPKMGPGDWSRGRFPGNHTRSEVLDGYATFASAVFTELCVKPLPRTLRWSRVRLRSRSGARARCDWDLKDFFSDTN